MIDSSAAQAALTALKEALFDEKERTRTEWVDLNRDFETKLNAWMQSVDDAVNAP